MPKLLYIDSSAFIRRVFGADGADTVDAAIARYIRRGATVVSSRLLWLETRRVSVRERLLGNDVDAIVSANLAAVTRLPMTEEVWAGAYAIAQHVKTLDSIHVATCQLAAADLLTFDANMRAVAEAVGIHVV